MPIVLRETITRTFLDRVKTTPDQVGFSYKSPEGSAGWRKVTFGKYFEEVKAVAYGLMASGIRAGDKVALLSNTRFEWSLCDMAVLGARAITVPIYASNTPDDIAHILTDSDSRLIFAENSVQVQKLLKVKKETPEAFRNIEKVVVFDAAALDPAAGHEEFISLRALTETARQEEGRDPTRFEKNLVDAKPEDLITICYTSGTTGIPKGAMLTQDNVMSVLEDAVAVLGNHFRPTTETILSFLPFSHVIGKVESMSVYVFGFHQYFAESPDTLLANMADSKPTVLFSVPRVFEKAYARLRETVDSSGAITKSLFGWAVRTGEAYHSPAASGGLKTPGTLPARYRLADRLVLKKVHARFGGRLRFVLCGGAPLSPDIARFFQNIGIVILEAYGLTETCAPVALNTPDAVRIGSVGKPLPDVAVKFDDDGEILLKSRKVFKGYYKRPEDTSEVLGPDGWFRTGDVGYIDQDGFLFITDRKKEIIVTSAGKNIAPQKIENLAKTYKFISQFVVHGDRRNYLTALVTLERDEIIKYATENHILFSGYPELVKNAKIQALIQRTVDNINSRLASFETIKKFVILPAEFSVESGELTPSMKVRRRVVSERYRAELDNMYA